MGRRLTVAGPTAEPSKALGILAKQIFTYALLFLTGRAHQQPSQFMVDRVARRPQALGLCIPFVPCREVPKLDVDCAQQCAWPVVTQGQFMRFACQR